MADKNAKQSEIDLPRIEGAVREILLAVGEDPERDGLRETPRRVAHMYAELFAGLRDDPERHLATAFDEKHHEMVHDEYIRVARKLIDTGLSPQMGLHLSDVQKFLPGRDELAETEPFPLELLAKQRLTSERS